jgi:L-lactate utilization protein LutC
MIDDFAAQLRANECEVLGPLSAAEARAAVIDRVRARGAVAVSSGDATLAAIDAVDGLRRDGVDVLLPDAPDWLERVASVEVGLTGAAIAVARPAALGLVAGRDSPRGTSLLPPVHVCVLRTSDIVATLADAFERVRADGLPSALTWIGGPSRTGDLEMILTIGVHGPRAVEVVLVEDGSGTSR